MTPGNVAQLELAAAFASRRALALRVGVALLLGLPLAIAEIPMRSRVAGLAVLTVFVSFFGAAVGMVRRRAEGQWQRLALLPIPRGVVWSDLLLASSLVDLVQVGPVVALFAAVNDRGAGVGALLGAAAALGVAVVVLNGLGMALAAGVRTNAEAHLAAALGVAAIAIVSGLVPTAGPLAPAVQAIARFSPVAWLTDALNGVVADAPSSSTRPALASGVILFILAAWAAARLARCPHGNEE